ncbi:uncharacterized protein LOC127699913 [Mytilus californianus]|uniref:uncharacterized protein LOC127699913 n=1 Tax=Mytilus californianus TaxID=6549 RepID=UPI00224867AB|nr:uncharacterized protein LOC127699913 [Mytilus californianus]
MQFMIRCFLGTVSSTTPSQSLIAVEIPKKGSSTTFHKGDEFTSTKSQNTLATRKGSNASFDINAVIGGTLGACSLIIVLVVLIVCKVRSKGIFTDSNTHNYEDTSRVNFSTTTYEDLDNKKHTNLTATTNQTCVIDEASTPVYEEVNKN